MHAENRENLENDLFSGIPSLEAEKTLEFQGMQRTIESMMIKFGKKLYIISFVAIPFIHHFAVVLHANARNRRRSMR